MEVLNLTTMTQKLLAFAANGYKAIGHQTITFGAGVVSLTVPDGANCALMLLEEVGATGTRKVIRFWEDGAIPTSSLGIPRGDMDAWDIVSRQNLENFRAIRVTAAAHILQVQYYQI